MSISLRVIHNNQRVSLSTAFENGFIRIVDDKIEATDQTSLSLSSKLFDCKGNELFENDLVQSIEGKKYRIMYDIGMFYLFDIETHSIHPMYIYKMGNTLDIEKIIN